MMKSFFKKLSLVMALAMVVSLVAPAGSAFAATAGIAYQGTTTAIEAINVEVGGDVVDLCFLGAPADWKTTFAWTSGDDTIASVDKAGKVTGLKAGETTVTITAGADASYKYTVKVTVAEPKAEVAVGQLTEIKAKAVFANKVSFKKEDASLYKIFDTVEGPVEVYWPIDVWEVAKDGLSVTFAPFVQFADGDNYVLRVGSYEVPFTTVIGEVTHVFTTYGNNSGANNNVAYITTEDMDDDQVSKLGVQIMSGAIDLTNIYKSKYDISYEFVGEDVESVDLDGDDGEIVVTDKTPFQVTAVLAYEDEAGEDKTVANVLPVTVTPQNVPAYEIVSVEDWAIYKSGDFSWSNKSVPAGDEGYNLVVKLKDSYGNYWVNNAAAAQSWNKIYNIEEGSTFVEEGYSIKFFSTNTDKYLVDEDGEVATYEKAKATIYVSLYKDTEEEDNVFVKNIYAFTLDITAAREIAGFWSDGSKVDLVIDEMVEWEDEFTEKNFAFMVHDQYYTYWDVAWGVTPEYEVTTSPEIAEGCGWELWAGENWSQIHLDANKLAEEAGKKTSVKFTIEEKESGKKTSFTVYLKKPSWVGTKDPKDTDVVVNGFDDKMFLETSKGYAEVDLGTKDVSLDWNGDVDGWSNSKNMSRTAYIEMFKSSNGQHVGYFTHDEITGFITNAKWDEATSGIAAGDVYVAVYNPKGKLVTEGTGLGQIQAGDNNHGYFIDLAKADSEGKINYAKDVAGKYTVKVYTVYNVDKKNGEIYDVDYVTETAYFNVSVNKASITLRDRKAIETTKTLAELDEIILDCFDFNINGSYWNVETSQGDANMIVDGSWKYTDKGDYIILHSVKVKVPFIGDADLVTGESYYEVEVKGINLSIKFVEE